MASPDREALRLRTQLRTRPIDELCARLDPFDPALEGPLYAPQVPPDAPTLRGWERTRALRRAGLLVNVSGDPLCSEARAAFVLDGVECASVCCFYEALKHGPAERAAIAAGAAPPRRPPARRRSFEYAGREIAVDSVEHGVLVARATAAKVEAHPAVRRALAATGEARLYIGDPHSQVLGRYMPLALMLLRLRDA
jgi:hypothetical protein